ncbi:hypothetical protein BDY19DRAFT_885242 [Irpex rosettiformis]|uniref:Uncharacterized protein n=1 Tax=Irpex rosettiformis TaxID=378272 RepID=A0ACB8UAY4_9APHY|nr:hypothetical protein BDY19DRAFT_885242 [Irpex rosettiformis]
MHDLYQVPPKAYASRRGSPMPFTTSLPPNATYMPSHSPRPPLPPSLPPLNLGTFVYPHTPFPFLDFSYPAEAPLTPNGPVHLSDKEIREIRATIYIPSGFLPTKRPQSPKIWGGAPIPSFIPLFATPQLVNHLQSGMSYQFRKPHPLEVHGLRRVYTDDSDLFLCALHAGWVKWSSTHTAKKLGRDLKLDVRLTREARYVGGFGSHYMGGSEDEEDFTGEDDGRSLLSAGWGNSHDGSGVEILNAQFVKKGTAHAYSIQNRSQRVLEYTDRHYALTCTRQTRKRRRILYEASIEDSDAATDAETVDAKTVSDRTITFGDHAGWSQAG